jgi:hypothetical protein
MSSSLSTKITRQGLGNEEELHLSLFQSEINLNLMTETFKCLS